MKKRYLAYLFLVTLVLTLLACAPSINEVAKECVQDSVLPGQSVTIGGVNYMCPQLTPTANNVTNAITESLESACKENGKIWQDPSNALWLAKNVVEPASSWKHEGDKWVYTYVPEHLNGAFGGLELRYKESFNYPGFGTFVLYSEEGRSRVVNNSNQSTWGFVKLELSCN